MLAHGALTLDAWNHIAVTYNGETQRIYVNGVRRGLTTKTGTIDNGSNVVVWMGDSPGGDRKPFTGRIDELRIYSHALSPAQIIADMETAVIDSDLTAPTVPPNLAAQLDSTTTASLTWETATDETEVAGYRTIWQLAAS